MKRMSCVLGMAIVAFGILASDASRSAEARALRARVQDEAGSPSDQRPQVQRGPIQKDSPIQSPVQKGGACAHRISYHHHCTVRKTCCTCGTIQQVLMVADPCCCGKVIAVPVCLPDCCSEAPSVDDRCGVLGRGVTVFHWCCGYKVKVVVGHCGDVVVHSYGR